MNSGIDYFEWNFGQVPPGGITLHIPFFCLSDKMPEDFYIPVDLSECTFPAEKSCEIYGGRLYLEQVEEVCPSPDSQIEELSVPSPHARVFAIGNSHSALKATYPTSICVLLMLPAIRIYCQKPAVISVPVGF